MSDVLVRDRHLQEPRPLLGQHGLEHVGQLGAAGAARGAHALALGDLDEIDVADVDAVDPLRLALGGDGLQHAVAAVVEHDDQDVGIVLGGRPQRLDGVEARPVAHHADDRLRRIGERRADAGREAEAEAAAGGGEETVRPHDGEVGVQRLVRARCLLDQDAVGRPQLAEGLIEEVVGDPEGLGHARRLGPRRLGADGALPHAGGEALGRQPHVGQHGGADGRTRRLPGIVGDEAKVGAVGDVVGRAGEVIGEHRRTEHQDEIRPLEAIHQSGLHGGQEAGEQRVALGEARARRLRARPHLGLQPLGEAHGGVPGAVAVDHGADHDHRLSGGVELARQLVQRLRRGCEGGQDFPLRQRRGDLVPVGERHRHQHGAARRLHGDVVGLGDGGRHIGGARRLRRPLHVRLRQLRGALVEQERVVRQQRARLLAGDDQERRAVAIGRVDGAHRMSEAGGRMQVHELGLAGDLGVAVGHEHQARLLQTQHVGEVLRQVGEHRDLGGARIAEDAGHAVPAQEVEDDLAHGLGAQPAAAHEVSIDPVQCLLPGQPQHGCHRAWHRAAEKAYGLVPVGHDLGRSSPVLELVNIA